MSIKLAARYIIGPIKRTITPPKAYERIGRLLNAVLARRMV